MALSFGSSGNGRNEPGIDRTKLRLAVFAAIVVAIFFALFSRLWFLQVLAAEDYRRLARENRVRLIQSEPPRGRILDRNGKVLVENRKSIAVIVDRQVVDTNGKVRRVLGRLSRVLDEPFGRLRDNLTDRTVSPYKPVAVATDVSESDVTYILTRQDHFPGVDVEEIPVRRYPQGTPAAHILGYVNEITQTQLRDPHFKHVRPRYRPGDIVGQSGVEYVYDRWLRGRPETRKVVVNSTGQVVDDEVITEEKPGNDLYLTLDLELQKITEKALENGLAAARVSYQAPAGAAVVMDVNTGEVVAMASSPTYNPRIATDGFTPTEWKMLSGNPATNEDDALLNRAIQSGTPPGSTFKIVTAGAAMATGIATPGTFLPCPPSVDYGDPPTTFNNWTSADLGTMGFPESLEVSCDTFYYELGWRMEAAYGTGLDSGDGTERFQDYMRRAGFGHDTGIDLPNENDGIVPDEEWCEESYEATKDDPFPTCEFGWLPGFSVNMAIGQGDLQVTPLQMAVTTAAVANGGEVLEPHVGSHFSRDTDDGEDKVIKEIEPEVRNRLGLDVSELSPIQQGMRDVVAGDQGTATTAFAGFPLNRYPVSGKTGTAQIGSVTSGLNYAWFVSYAPSDDPEYAIAVYLEKAGHGGESAAPVAREIWEGIFGLDKETDVTLGEDASG